MSIPLKTTKTVQTIKTPMRIAIEGNIGCGKSSLMRTIEQSMKLPVVLEPVDTDWREGLTYFYEDNRRWGFTFNVNVLTTYSQWKNVKQELKTHVIFERSPVTCKQVFTQLHIDSGVMTDYEYNLYNSIYQQLAWAPDVMIYLRTDPNVCLERMQTRGRQCEKGVPIEYLEGVHKKHEIMVEALESNAYAFSENKIIVFIVDANKDKDEVVEQVFRIINSLC